MKNTISPSDIIAILAVLISLASVAYARASANAALASNKIGLHQPRKDIYDGLLQFRSLFIGMDAHPTEEEIGAFYVQSVAPSQIYLDSELAKRIHSIYERSWELIHLIEIAESGDKPGMSKWDYINPFQELGKTELENVIRSVTAQIHVGST